MAVMDIITLAGRVASLAKTGESVTLPRMTGSEFKIFTQALKRRVTR